MTNIPDENGHVFHTVRETVCFKGAGGRTDEFLSRISHMRVSNELQAAILAFAYKIERDNARLREAAEKALVFIDRLTFDDRPGPGNSLCRLSHIATWHAENMRAALVQS